MSKNKSTDNMDYQINWSVIDEEILKIGYNYNIFTLALISDNLDNMNSIKSDYDYCVEVPGNHRLVNKYADQIKQYYHHKLKASYIIRWESRNICIIKLYLSREPINRIKQLNDSNVDYDEYILSAAISLTLKDGDSPVIVGGYRHADCFSTAVQLGYTGCINADEQGFLTSKSRFVDRKEAKLIAKRAGQLIRDSKYTNLFSEDLY